jgi:hypothetical protein
MEKALGALINAMNPYSNPACQDVTTVAGRMEAVVYRPLRRAVQAANATDADRVAQLDVEIDNYQGGEWSFMGQMYKIKRSLLIPYRYEVRDRHGKESGVWATGYLLIGYTGANGG